MVKNKKTAEVLQINQKQQLFISNYLQSKTIIEACAMTGIERKTYYTWCKSKTFKDSLERAKSELMEDTIDRTGSYLMQAIEITASKMISTEEAIQLRACQMIMDLYLKVKEQEIISRIEKIEEVLLNENN